jgi:hypothetical protein
MAREKVWFSCCSMLCTCLTWCLIRTLCRFVLDPTAKPSHAEATVMCKVGYLETKEDFMKLLSVFLA